MPNRAVCKHKHSDALLERATFKAVAMVRSSRRAVVCSFALRRLEGRATFALREPPPPPTSRRRAGDKQTTNCASLLVGCAGGSVSWLLFGETVDSRDKLLDCELQKPTGETMTKEQRRDQVQRARANNPNCLRRPNNISISGACLFGQFNAASCFSRVRLGNSNGKWARGERTRRANRLGAAAGDATGRRMNQPLGRVFARRCLCLLRRVAGAEPRANRQDASPRLARRARESERAWSSSYRLAHQAADTSGGAGIWRAICLESHQVFI